MSEFPEKKRHKDVRFNVISVSRGWVGVEFPEKNRYVTLQWPLRFTCLVQVSLVSALLLGSSSEGREMRCRS